jgi:hypothetical protein
MLSDTRKLTEHLFRRKYGEILATLPRGGSVELRLIPRLGFEEVEHATGSRRGFMKATHLASGVYFYRLEAGGFVSLKRMVVLT